MSEEVLPGWGILQFLVSSEDHGIKSTWPVEKKGEELTRMRGRNHFTNDLSNTNLYNFKLFNDPDQFIVDPDQVADVTDRLCELNPSSTTAFLESNSFLVPTHQS